MEFSTTFLDYYSVFVSCRGKWWLRTAVADCQHVNRWIDQSRCVPVAVAVPTPCPAPYQHGGVTTDYRNAGCTLQPPITPTTTHHWSAGQAQPALHNQDPSPSCATKPVDLVQDDTGLTGFEIANLPASRTVTPPLSVSSCSPRVLTSRKTSNISLPTPVHAYHPLPARVFLLLPTASSRDNLPLCQLIVIFEDQC